MSRYTADDIRRAINLLEALATWFGGTGGHIEAADLREGAGHLGTYLSAQCAEEHNAREGQW